MIYKKVTLGALLIVVSVSTYLFLKHKQTISNPDISNTDYFTVGTAAGYAPFVSINPQGDYEGFDIDVACALAKQMGKQLKIKDLGSMTSLFIALDQGSIDAIIWGLSITADRLKKVAMVHYQGALCNSYSLLFWKTIPDNIHTIHNMAGKTVCVEPTSAQDVVLSKYTFINKIAMEKVDDALLNLQYGKSDAAFVEPAIAKKFKNKYPEIQILDVPLEENDHVHGIGIAVRKNNHATLTQITQATQSLQQSGTIKALEEKWGII